MNRPRCHLTTTETTGPQFFECWHQMSVGIIEMPPGQLGIITSLACYPHGIPDKC